MTAAASFDLGIIAAILSKKGDGVRFQDPKIEQRVDVRRPWYFIRPVVPVVQADLSVVRKQTAIHLGFCDKLTLSKARAAKQKVMATINEGQMVIQAQLPFRALVEKFLAAHVPQVGETTQAKYRGLIDNHILLDLGGLKTSELDQPTIQAWLNAKKDTGLSWATRAGLRDLLATIFTRAAAWKLWNGANPCVGLSLGPQIAAREKRRLSPAQIALLFAALPETPLVAVETVRLMLLTMIATTFRVSEALGLRWADVDIETGTVTVTQRWSRGNLAHPKTPASCRTRQLGPLAEEFQRAYPGPQARERLVFCDRDGGPLDDREVLKRVVRPAAKAAGLYWVGFGFHTFRRLSISWRQEVGATPYEAMRAAGHTQPRTTWLYTLTDAAREREQVTRVCGLLIGEPKGGTQ